MSSIVALSVNQTDRIQGMAAYMNTEGSNIEWLSLGLIVFGAISVWMLLKWLAAMQSSGKGGGTVKGKRLKVKG